MDAIVRLLAAILVPLFFIGMVGSLLVVIVTVVRDMHEITNNDRPE